MTFVRADDGAWYAKTKTDHCAYSLGVRWLVGEGDDRDNPLVNRLDEPLDRSRSLA